MRLDLWRDLVRWKILFCWLILKAGELWIKKLIQFFFLHVRIVRIPSLLWRSRIHKCVGEFTLQRCKIIMVETEYISEDFLEIL